MNYYLGVHPSTEVGMGTVWFIDGKKAKRVDAAQEEAVLSFLPKIEIEHHPDWTFFPLTLSLGEFYPRMARPSSTYFRDSPGSNPAIDKMLLETAHGQLMTLREQMEKMFRTVHPIAKNFETYGHDFRNILILASTEVESHWKGILKANGVRSESTNDYVKLLPAMKLDEYAILLPFYPWLDPVRPFFGWNATHPTRSLGWYDAYNAVKHDREANFERGSLQNALHAICAVAVLLFAQFGRRASHNSRELNSSFELCEVPKWDGSEVYPVSSPSGPYTPKLFPF